MSQIVAWRNRIISFFYRYLAKPIYFGMDPEFVHDRMMLIGKILASNPIGRGLTWLAFGYGNKILEQKIAGITFKNPVGLAAGFDKNAELIPLMPAVGFGFEEVGSITGERCEGNPKPRLWRLPKSKSLVVYYGLKNNGAEEISTRLRGISTEGKFAFPVGISLAKTNSEACVDTDTAVADYVKGYKAFQAIGDYYTINISCPNAFGGEPFTDESKLNKLLTALDKYYVKGKPVLVKLSPDLKMSEIDVILAVCAKHQVDGYVCTNLTKVRVADKIKDVNVPEKGGLSGKLVSGLSDDLIAHVYKATKGKKIIIGVGGIFTAADAYAKIRLGANLVQLITGMIYEGPQMISEVNRGLVELLKRDGFKNVSEAVGVDS